MLKHRGRCGSGAVSEGVLWVQRVTAAIILSCFPLIAIFSAKGCSYLTFQLPHVWGSTSLGFVPKSCGVLPRG